VIRLCEEADCFKSPYYGYEDTNKAIVCADHKRPGMVNMTGRRCQTPECKKIPYYGWVRAIVFVVIHLLRIRDLFTDDNGDGTTS